MSQMMQPLAIDWFFLVRLTWLVIEPAVIRLVRSAHSPPMEKRASLPVAKNI